MYNCTGEEDIDLFGGGHNCCGNFQWRKDNEPFVVSPIKCHPRHGEASTLYSSSTKDEGLLLAKWRIL